MTISIVAFVVCLLVLLIFWLIAEFVVRTWFPTPPHLAAVVRLIFGILVILCILHALGVVQMPVSVQ